MTKIKALVFDFGGVVVSNGVEEALKRFWEFIPVWKLPFFLIYAFIYLPKIEKGVLTEYRAWQKLKPFFNHKKELTGLRQNILNRFEMNEPLLSEIKKLKNHYQVALLTNNLMEWMDIFEERFKLNLYFFPIVNSAEVKLRKPNPAIFRLLLKKMGFKPEECIFVDDHRRNVWTARALGFKAILFKNNQQFFPLLKKTLTETDF